MLEFVFMGCSVLLPPGQDGTLFGLGNRILFLIYISVLLSYNEYNQDGAVFPTKTFPIHFNVISIYICTIFKTQTHSPPKAPSHNHLYSAIYSQYEYDISRASYSSRKLQFHQISKQSPIFPTLSAQNGDYTYYHNENPTP